MASRYNLYALPFTGSIELLEIARALAPAAFGSGIQSQPIECELLVGRRLEPDGTERYTFGGTVKIRLEAPPVRFEGFRDGYEITATIVEVSSGAEDVTGLRPGDATGGILQIDDAPYLWFKKGE